MREEQCPKGRLENDAYAQLARLENFKKELSKQPVPFRDFATEPVFIFLFFSIIYLLHTIYFPSPLPTPFVKTAIIYTEILLG